MLFTEQEHEFGVAVNDASKSHGARQYIIDRDWFISMNFDKALMYVHIQEPNQWYINNITNVMLTLERTWDP